MFDQLYGGLAEIFGDYNTPGNPASGKKPPLKVQIRNFLKDRLERSVFVQDAAAGVGNGGNDFAAFQDTIDYCITEGHKAVRVPAGVTYNIEGNLLIPAGITIIGDGPQGSNEELGCSIIHHSNGDLFTWDGTDPGPSTFGFAGTGGGLLNMLLLKGPGYAGGRPWYLKATNDAHRPGEMILSNILSVQHSSDVNAVWLNNGEIDGLLANTPGGRGVRTILLHKVRGGAVSVSGETFVFKQVTHLFMQGCGADQGVGAPAGMKFSGHNDGVYIDGMSLGGNFLVAADDANNTMHNLHFSGKCGGTFINNDTQADGFICATQVSGAPINKSPKLHCVFPDKPQAYIAYRNSIDADKTGDGTVYTVPFDQELSDLTGLASTGVGAILVTGRYRVHTCVTAAGLAVGNTSATVQIVRSIGASNVFPKVFNPSGALWNSQYFAFEHQADMMLAYGDNIRVELVVAGGAKVVDIYGAGSGQFHTYVSLEYLGTG